MDYTKHYATTRTPQSEQIPGKNMVVNNAGGFTFAIDDWSRLDRFLVLGSDGGTYYVNEHDLTVRNADAVKRCVEADGPRSVARIVEISEGGRAPKNDPALFALAMACKFGNRETRGLAYRALPRVARIGTHLFSFVQYSHKGFGLSGRGWQSAIQHWYDDKDPADLTYQLIKYQQRNGWSHRDVLRLARPRPLSVLKNALYRYVTKGEVPDIDDDAVARLYAFESAKTAESAMEIARLIRVHRLTREMIPTNYLSSLDVWTALLEKMPLNAMVRNLGKMTSIGLLKPLSDETSSVCMRLREPSYFRRSRLHPLSILIALRTYQQGHGIKGKLQWSPVAEIVDALDDAFYLAFQNVESTGKRIMLALDTSGSMARGIGQYPISCREAAGAMAMITARTESRHVTTVFTCAGDNPMNGGPSSRFHGFENGISTVTLSPRQRLDDIIQFLNDRPMGGTDCSLPMRYALERGLDVDAFVIYTDNETWHGDIHPVQALAEYRRKTGIPAKLIVVGMIASGFSIADPNDRGMLDICGFDTATPQVISQFIGG